MFKGILGEGGRASDTTPLADRGTGSGRRHLPLEIELFRALIRHSVEVEAIA